VHRQEINEYPEDVKAEFLRVSEWIRTARKQYGDRVAIRLVDPQSLGGMWKVLRHRIRRYPTFFLNAGERVVGWEGDPDAALARALAQRTSP
jgi:acyl-CoA synthetase (AMP-forming)/AMP-acid ligase II